MIIFRYGNTFLIFGESASCNMVNIILAFKFLHSLSNTALDNVINPNVLDTTSGFFKVSVLNVAKACILHSSFLYEPTAASELAISFETNSGATSIIFSIRCNANNFSSLDDAVYFDADTFKEVLVANKDCESATLYVSSQGLAKVNFKVDDFDSTYVLVAKTTVD